MNDIDKKNTSIIKLKLLMFQSFFLLLNLEKNIDSFDDLNWFYKFYQYFYENNCKFLNLNENYYKTNKICFPKNKLTRKNFFYIYNFIIKYIKDNKNNYNN